MQLFPSPPFFGGALHCAFSFPPSEISYYAFRFDRPVSFNGFGTPRVHPDSSMFMTHQVLTDVLIADYDYVYLP